MKHFIILLIFLGSFFRGATQTSNVQIIDLNVTTRTQIDTPIHKRFVLPDSTWMRISFKVNDVVSCNKVHVYMGTVKDTFDVRNIEVLFTHPDSSYYLSFNGITNKVENHLAVIVNKFSITELQQYHYITLFVEDTNALRSNTLYFKKNN